MSNALILPLDKASYKSIELVGGKAASLGEMLSSDIPVPDGFVITTRAYRLGMSSELENEILAAYDQLGVKRVAVRSSAVAEDSKSASWAGQLETYLNVTEPGLIEAVEKCWDSIKSERAEEYADEHGVSEDQRAVAVVVQAMVSSDISGVLFTANPVTQNRKEMLLEVVYGLGEMLVQGVVTPESFTTDKNGRILSHEPSKQHKKLICKDGKNQEVSVEPKERILGDSLLNELAHIAQKVESHYKGVPQDIEWAIYKDKIYIVQSRPITTLTGTAGLPEFFQSPSSKIYKN